MGTKSKSTKRIENKKKKMAALLEICKLNEHDRKTKKTQTCVATSNDSSNAGEEVEPNSKRIRTDGADDEEGAPSETGEPELGLTGKQKFCSEEYLQLKKMLREKAAKKGQQPNFRLREVGLCASLETDFDERVPLWFQEVQHLVMYSQLGQLSSYSPARWCALDKINRLSTTCVFIIENVSLHHYLNSESNFPFLSSTFDTKVEILKTSDYVRDLSVIPLTGTQMKRFFSQCNTMDSSVIKSNDSFDSIRNMFPVRADADPALSVTAPLPLNDNFPRTQLLLSGWQMVHENFPMPIKGLKRRFPRYIMTKECYELVTPNSPMYGIDCEMCQTTVDSELTRVSVVNENLETIYDSLVKPDNKITNYLTKFSGITAKMMKDVKKRLEDVQEDLKKILPGDCILVGHGLSNDMHALKMMHPYVIDTSVVFNLTGDRSRKAKLKTLTQEFLRETIQESKSGHCSTEDSKASLKLVQLKLKKNLYFGDAVMGPVHTDNHKTPKLGTYNYATNLLMHATKRTGKTVVVVSSDDVCSQFKQHADRGLEPTSTTTESNSIKFVSESSCKGVVKKLCESMGQFSLNIGLIKVPEGQSNDAKELRNIDKFIRKIYEKTPSVALVIVILASLDEGNGGCFIHVKRE